jgi:hypothetical protein
MASEVKGEEWYATGMSGLHRPLSFCPPSYASAASSKIAFHTSPPPLCRWWGYTERVEVEQLLMSHNVSLAHQRQQSRERGEPSLVFLLPSFRLHTSPLYLLVARCCGCLLPHTTCACSCSMDSSWCEGADRFQTRLL